MDQKKKVIVMAWGGTGGHVFPIKSLILHQKNLPAINSQIQQIYRFWEKKGLEFEVYKELHNQFDNLTFIPIASWKLRRQKTFSALLLNLRDLFLFGWGLILSLIHLKKIKADVIFCKGGYVALPVVIAAKLLSKPIVVHESDVHPGLVNRIASKYASKSFTWFDKVFPGAETLGQILSEEILPNDASDLVPTFSSQSSVLVMGGSQWSRDLYLALAQLLKTTPQLHKLHFTILLWKLNYWLKSLFDPFDNVVCLDFVSQKEIGELYLRSDFTITRAGTTSLAEQELFDLKLMMIPIPWTHDQFDNASWYVEHKGGILIQQDREDFISRLQEVLLEHLEYKKKLRNIDREKMIRKAKDRIWDVLISF